MRFDPSLQLRRLVVLKDGRRAYDEFFHKGVNVIRGVPGKGNSVGKSTIADMIFFALGGDLTNWKTEAESCDLVFAEIELNGSIVTLQREITSTSQQPMWIFFGDFELSSDQGREGWQRFTYTRVSNRESFTQVLFRLLDMPEVPAEANANITMHQALRLMYVDQMTPVDRIFRFEAKDSAVRRQAVGDLLCGVLDGRIYPAQLRLRAQERKLERVIQQHGTLNRVLTASGESFNLDFVEARRRSVLDEIAVTRERIATLKDRRYENSEQDDDSTGTIDKLKETLDQLNADLSNERVILGQDAYSIQDADELIAEIEKTLVHLDQGEEAGRSLGAVKFNFCPSCFGVVPDKVDDQHCALCRLPLDAENERSRTARMRNELDIQLKESRLLQEARKEEYQARYRQIAKLTSLRDIAASEYLSISQTFLTEASAEIDKLSKRVGYLERELLDIERERSLAEQLEELAQQRDDLNSEVLRLKDDIERWKKARDRRQSVIYSKIQSETVKFLAADLHTEAEFEESSQVYFDFAEDRVTVNGKSGFSASSLTVLRNSFHLAMHTVSCADKSMRYPRFLLLDNIEDKGMTEERSQNFQRMIVEASDQIEVDHQIIFTTSMIAPDIEESDMTVGEMYTFDNKSLAVLQGKQASLV